MSTSLRSPAFADVAVLVGIVVGSAVAVHAGGGAQLAGSWLVTAGAAFVSALVFGLPALAFTFERGRAAPSTLLPLGALSGSLPLLALGASGVLSLYFRSGGWERVAWALDLGMPIPSAGVVFWPRFFRLEVQAILLGFGSALMFWLVRLRARSDTRAFHVLLALFVLGTVMTIATFLR